MFTIDLEINEQSFTSSELKSIALSKRIAEQAVAAGFITEEQAIADYKHEIAMQTESHRIDELLKKTNEVIEQNRALRASAEKQLQQLRLENQYSLYNFFPMGKA